MHIGPDETETLARIPADLLFPAPRMPRGSRRARLRRARSLPDARRRPLLDLRAPPATCRTYDCRIFTATGVDADDDKVEIHPPVAVEFDVSADDEATHAAVRAAATYLDERADVSVARP